MTHDEMLGKVLGVVLTDDGVHDELAESQIAINDWKAMVGHCAQDVGGTRAIAGFDYFDYRPVTPAF